MQDLLLSLDGHQADAGVSADAHPVEGSLTHKPADKVPTSSDQVEMDDPTPAPSTPDLFKTLSVSQIDAGFQLGLNDVTQWDETDVEAWLRIVDLQDLTDIFLENGIVGIDLLDLAEDDLLSMKVWNSDLRQSILKEAQLLVRSAAPFSRPFRPAVCCVIPCPTPRVG